MVKYLSKKLISFSLNGTQCCFDCYCHPPRCCCCCCRCCCRKTGQGCDRSRGPDFGSLRRCCSPWQAEKSHTIIQSLNYEDRCGRDRFFTFFFWLINCPFSDLTFYWCWTFFFDLTYNGPFFRLNTNRVELFSVFFSQHKRIQTFFRSFYGNTLSRVEFIYLFQNKQRIVEQFLIISCVVVGLFLNVELFNLKERKKRNNVNLLSSFAMSRQGRAKLFQFGKKNKKLSIHYFLVSFSKPVEKKDATVCFPWWLWIFLGLRGTCEWLNRSKKIRINFL